MDIGQNLYIARTRKGMTQAALAAATGIPQGNICNAERGRRDITMATFLRICYALDIKPHEVFLEAETRGAPLSLTRDRVERMAGYAAGGGGRLTPAEKRAADLIKSILTAQKAPLSDRQIRLNWLALKRLMDAKGIDLLCQRVRDAMQRNA